MKRLLFILFILPCILLGQQKEKTTSDLLEGGTISNEKKQTSKEKSKENLQKPFTIVKPDKSTTEQASDGFMGLINETIKGEVVERIVGNSGSVVYDLLEPTPISGEQDKLLKAQNDQLKKYAKSQASIDKAKAQQTKFDPNKLNVEDFLEKGVQHKLEFNDKKGNTYKIYNTDSAKGLYIKKNGKWLKHGVHYSFYSSRLYSKTNYRFGKKEGVYESYHSNNNVKVNCEYSNDKKEGNWQYFRDDKSLFEEVTYKNGLKEGIRIEYHKNGEKNFVTQYSNGVRHGDNLQYNNKGKLVSKTVYNKGKKVGKTKWY